MYPRIPRYNKLHQNDRFTCKNCGTSYTSARGLTSHIRQQKACEHSYFPCQQEHLSLPEPHPAQPTLPVHQPYDDSSSDEEDGDDLISSTTESSCESDNDFPSGPPEEEHSIMDEDSLVTPDFIFAKPPTDRSYTNGIQDPPQIPYLTDEQVEAALLEIMKEMKAPLYFYKRILNWACQAYHNKYYS